MIEFITVGDKIAAIIVTADADRIGKLEIVPLSH